MATAERQLREGDACTAYCKDCERETVWTLVPRVFHNIWKCLVCGAERIASKIL